MKNAVCSVYDSAVGSYGRPIYAPSVGAAMRSFTDEVNRVAQDNPLNKHPDDFHLELLAEFDDETGEYCVPETGGRRVLARAKDLI